VVSQALDPVAGGPGLPAADDRTRLAVQALRYLLRDPDAVHRQVLQRRVTGQTVQFCVAGWRGHSEETGPSQSSDA
jgi:hypothetical protein